MLASFGSLAYIWFAHSFMLHLQKTHSQHLWLAGNTSRHFWVIWVLCGAQSLKKKIMRVTPKLSYRQLSWIIVDMWLLHYIEMYLKQKILAMSYYVVRDYSSSTKSDFACEWKVAMFLFPACWWNIYIFSQWPLKLFFYVLLLLKHHHYFSLLS